MSELIATFATFTLTVLVIELTPGPNMAWLAVLSADRGRKAGFAAVLGVTLGQLTLGLMAALGLAAIVAQTPWLFELLRNAGTIFLLYLAWEGWRHAGESSPVRLAGNLRRHFRDGLVINLLNPKAGLFFLIVLPDYILADRAALPQAISLTLIAVAVALAIHIIIVLLAARAATFLQTPQSTLWFRRVLAVLLAGIAIWLFLDTAPV